MKSLTKYIQEYYRTNESASPFYTAVYELLEKHATDIIKAANIKYRQIGNFNHIGSANSPIFTIKYKNESNVWQTYDFYITGEPWGFKKPVVIGYQGAHYNAFVINLLKDNKDILPTPKFDSNGNIK